GHRFESGILHNQSTGAVLFFFMEYHVYIIYSVTKDRYYIGQCEDLDKRISDHCNSRSGYTKGVSDWELKWSKTFVTRSEALQAERFLKKKKSRKYLEYIISGGELG
ncbi:GIY-YIG nuclease family protein, partial [Fulvivirga imtechensis]|uniref:GIY-YIG nuclease family protein n=1 Tax=Fulvivirga imtechensis TaxID=881893 RepID=UPI001FDEF846